MKNTNRTLDRRVALLIVILCLIITNHLTNDDFEKKITRYQTACYNDSTAVFKRSISSHLTRLQAESDSIKFVNLNPNVKYSISREKNRGGFERYFLFEYSTVYKRKEPTFKGLLYWLENN